MTEARGCVVVHGDCIEVMRGMEAESVDAIVTDPPYGLEFMGKEWDRFRVDDPGTNRHRGEYAGVQGFLGGGDGTHAARSTRAAVGFGGGKRPHTSRCVGCGKRDQFRNAHSCPEGTEWRNELIDPYAAPPTMLAFQEWTRAWALEAIRVLRPGGHLLAFGGTRTYHRLAGGVEDAGFEVRDCLAWLYGQGFPKSLNLHGEYEGWGTTLKPAFEPIVVARKPLVGTVAKNVERYGTGALNIDATRIGEPDGHGGGKKASGGFVSGYEHDGFAPSAQGRWPANVAFDEDAAAQLDASVPESTSRIGKPRASAQPGEGWGMTATGAEYDDRGGPSRFFYTAKASRKERGEGNTHPTVKPIALMRWLVRLVTPKGGLVLDPFAGSGTTGLAAIDEGMNCILIEREAEYVTILNKRLGVAA